MMKNTEWGAVAYLSHSIYGINYEIRINNNANFLTGYAATTENGSSSTTDVAMWNTTTGYLASTTGNIMGIYDMSGGAYEYVMGVMKDANGNLMSGYNSTYNSGFNGTLFIGNAITNGINFLDDKYYDIYKFDDENINRARKILGDATGELGSFKNYVSSWYNDTSYFVDTERCWFGRGGISNSSYSAGIFNVSNSGGSAYFSNSFRIALGL